MGAIRKAKAVCLIAGICYNDSTLNQLCLERLQEKFGAIESESAPILFTHTNYYANEMGTLRENIIKDEMENVKEELDKTGDELDKAGEELEKAGDELNKTLDKDTVGDKETGDIEDTNDNK